MSSTAEDELESSSSANLVPSKRDRKQTEKGKQFQVQLLEDERLSVQRSWRKQLNRVENYLGDETEPEELQSERIFLESTMEILLSAHERLLEALDDLSTKRVAQEKFEKMELEHSDMLKRLNQKITDTRKGKRNVLSYSSIESKKSSRSSAVIDRKADTAVKVAKLKTELYFADDKATKVAELRKFRLTKKLASVEAEKKAIDEVEESKFSPVDINMINKDELVRKYLRSQASSRTECSISTVETYISGKSKIVPPKSFSKIVPSSQDKPTDQKIKITEEPENSPVYLQDSKPKGMIYPQDEREITQPQTSVFCDFLKREARIACNPVAMSRVIGEERKVQPPRDQRSGWSNRNKPFDARALTTGSEEVKVERKSNKRTPERCRLCKSAHSLDDCEKFAKMSYAEKLEVVKSNGLCLGCLRYGHMKRDCRGKKVCTTCKGFHPTSLHNATPRASQQTERPEAPSRSTEEVVITSHRVSTQDPQNRNACDSHSLIVPVWLHHKATPERKELVFNPHKVKPQIIRKTQLKNLCSLKKHPRYVFLRGHLHPPCGQQSISECAALTSSFDMNNSDGKASLKQQKSPDVAAATIEEYRTCREWVGGVVYGEPKNQT
ncbi:hypothetical protein pdam_00024091 [Pocillopora damicornis]|uniref:CCHC-type domain-containing protein n=1 Tax=Pocillopora damicornis TaxID=46731 RepID=A0A3M6UFK9_POCDA|nr:hypothetical protein pdam_00024091 [Pocillopora damicornis]